MQAPLAKNNIIVSPKHISPFYPEEPRVAIAFGSKDIESDLGVRPKLKVSDSPPPRPEVSGNGKVFYDEEALSDFCLK